MGLTVDELREKLKAQFDERHWNLWNGEYGHDFFELHFKRTWEYDQAFGDLIQGKTILEVGGYPGLLISLYLHRQCKVDTIESLEWTRDHYRVWAKEHGVTLNDHDLIQGDPHLSGLWDFAVMSDVHLHLDGFPKPFMEWLVRHSIRVIICWEPGKEGLYPDAKSGSMRRVFPMPTEEVFVSRMEECGAELDFKNNTEYRQILIFRRKT